MAVKTLKEIVDAHSRILEQFKAQMQAAERQEAPTRESFVRDKEKMLAGLEARLDSARKTRDEELRRLDQDIARLEGKIKRLQAEIASDKESIARASEAAHKSSKPSVRRTRGKGPSVNRLKGLEKTLKARLEQEGIKYAWEVAEMKPAALAKLLQVPEERAQVLISEAKKLE